MGRKRLVPEDSSLGLLLDTMCNTFGGVMFIAITLMVINAFIPKAIETLTPEQRDETHIEKLNTEAKAMEARALVFAETRHFKEKIIERYRNHPNLSLLGELAKLKEQNGKLFAKIAELEGIKAETDFELKKITLAQNKLVDEKSEIEKQLAKVERKIREKEKFVKDAYNNFKESAPTEHRKIIFGKLEKTSKTPFWIILSQNKLYRISGEIASTVDGVLYPASPDVKHKYDVVKKVILYEPVAGKGLLVKDTTGFKTALSAKLLNVFPSDNFISIIADQESFTSLSLLIAALREKSFQTNWRISPFALQIVDDAKYNVQ